jgi:hypothetical protein
MPSSLPTFLLIGAAKSGTTSFYEYLGQHPDVFISPLKEPNFFAFEDETVSFCGPGDNRCNRLSITSLDAYRQLFADTDTPARGEASPSSLYYPRAAARIDEIVPNAQILAVLRDPVERAYSNFLMMIKQGREPHADFEKALAEEHRRLEAGWSYFWSYTRFGFYHEQLSRYYDRFPPDQIHIYLFRDLVEHPVATVQDAYRALGVDDTFKPNVSTQYNPSGIPKMKWLHRLLYHAGIRVAVRERMPEPVRRFTSEQFSGLLQTMQNWKKKLMHANLRRPPLPDDVRAELRDLYRNDIHRLQNLIDRDLSHWLED